MYLEIHNRLIEKAKSENRAKTSDIYYECHHIIPKHMNGSNDEDNLVLLTFREHVITHFLLWKIYAKPQDLLAYKMRSGQKEEAQRLRSKLGVFANRNGGKGFTNFSNEKNPMKNPDTVKQSIETKLKKYGRKSIFSLEHYENICKANKLIAMDPISKEKRLKSRSETINNMSPEERKLKFSRSGESNGNFNQIRGYYEVINPEGNMITYESQEHIMKELNVSQSFLVRNRNKGKLNNQSKNPTFHKWNDWEFLYFKNPKKINPEKEIYKQKQKDKYSSL